MSDKICALIRQTWYETAKRNLQPAERLTFYEICLEYEFNDILPDDDVPFGARLLFDMVRNDIDNDKHKARARAERSRANGARGGRPPGSDAGSEKVTTINNLDDNPEKPSGLLNNLYIHNTTQHNTDINNNSLSSTDNEDSHALFSIALNFFERGCSKPVEEAQTFWGYYAALGWKTKDGREVVDRLALANAWRLQDCARYLIRRRAPYADLMHKCRPTELVLLSDYVSMERNATREEVVITFMEDEAYMILEHKYMPALKQWIPRKQDGSYYDLNYKFMQQRLL